MKHPRHKEPAVPAIWTDLREQAIRMRGALTPAEAKLWSLLRGGRLDGLKFRRQHAVERFIVDFYCVRAALVVEVDGPVHDQLVEADEERQEHLESLGLRVLRFTNDEVLQDTNRVLQVIRQTASERLN